MFLAAHSGCNVPQAPVVNAGVSAAAPPFLLQTPQGSSLAAAAASPVCSLPSMDEINFAWL